MIHDYQCVTEKTVASSRLMKARQYVTAETLMMGFVSSDDCKISWVATRHGHADASVAYWCGRTTM